MEGSGLLDRPPEFIIGPRIRADPLAGDDAEGYGEPLSAATV